MNTERKTDMVKVFKRYTAVFLLLATILSLCACGQEQAGEQPEEEPVVGQGSEAGQQLADAYAADDVFSVNSDAAAGFNPLRTTNVANLMFLPLVYDTVFIVDENFEVSSDIVTSVTTEDYEWWVFTVDTDIICHDGTNLTAKDVAYSIQRAMGREQYRSRLSCIYGCSSMSEDAFAISTYEPMPQLTSLLNIPVIKYGSMSEEIQPGTGPYMFDETRTKLVEFDRWHGEGELPADTIYLKEYTSVEETVYAYKDSLIDIVVNDPAGMLNVGYGTANETRYISTTCMHYLGFNENSVFFRYTAYRYGFNFIVDRERIVSDVMDNCAVATSTPVHPNSPLYNSEFGRYYSYSMQKAKNCYTNSNVGDFDGDGYLEYMAGGTALDIVINFVVCADSAAKVAAAEIIKGDLEELGFNVNLRSLAWDDYVTALEEGDFDVYYGEVKLAADFNLSQMLSEEGGLNYGGHTDPGYVSRITAYLQATDENRKSAADDMCKYLIESAPIIPVCFERREVLTHRGVVSGMSATQYNVFNGIENWTINLG